MLIQTADLVGDIKAYQGNRINGTLKFSRLKSTRESLTSKQYSVKYVLRGQEKYRKSGKQIILNKGEAIFVRPYEQIEADFNNPNYSEGVCLYLDQDIIGSESESQLPQLLPDFKLSFVDTALHPFFSNAKEQTNTDQALSSFLSSLNHFISQKNRVINRLECTKVSTKKMLWNHLEQAKSFILENFSSQITLSDIAESAYLSPFHFQRSFKQAFGISPTQYLISLRMRKAKELYQHGEALSSIALQCGYEDKKYFIKTFKKRNSQLIRKNTF